MLMDEIINSLHINGTLLHLTQYGSHLYGTHTENSDLDFRGVYIPTIDDLILHKDRDEINEEIIIELEDYKNLKDKNIIIGDESFPVAGVGYTKKVKVDIKIFSLQKFIRLCSKADTNALDLLFSLNNNNIPQYTYSVTTRQKKEEPKNLWDNSVYIAKSYIPFWYILQHKDKLINTDRLESPITYAFKQATKYGLKGKRRLIIMQILEKAKLLSDIHTVEDILPLIENMFDDKYLRIDELYNKGKMEKYLFVCGVQHQFNLNIEKFKQRLQDKIDKEYTSQRTIDAADGNDWKALSHAIRILFEIKQLLEIQTIQFPVDPIVKQIKLGQISREDIDNLFDNTFQDIMEQIKQNTLNWKYDEEFWDNFILECTKKANEHN